MQQLKKLLPLFLLAESISYLGYYLPAANLIGFLFLVTVGIYFGCKKYHYLAGLLLAELMIGSKGYLFVFAFGGFHLSIRMALWALVLIFWAFQLVREARRQKSLEVIKQYLMPADIKIFWPLLAVAIFAVVNALVRHNGLGNLYSDANAWGYFLLIWPAYYTAKNLKGADREFYVGVLISAVAWLTIKTWLILYFFSHDFGAIDDLYHWVRDTGVGEITAIKGSFYRIFIQSHVYPLVGLVLSWWYLLKESKRKTLRTLVNDKTYLSVLGIASALLSVILIGLSRSFWVGLFLALIALTLMIFLEQGDAFTAKVRTWLRFCLGLLASLAVAVFIVFVIVRFPFPKNTLEFDATQVLRERATETNEVAIGSRWALLPVLGREIRGSWLLGYGFGKTVTYESKDPRVVSQTGGEYTTYAFEWGWLDLWLKLGLIGLAAYAYLLYKLWLGATDESVAPVRLTLITLIGLHIFTPYLNHPLGIGLILLIFGYMISKRQLLLNLEK